MARLLSLVITTLCFAVAAGAGEPLFPQPLHLTREIHDPIAGSVTVVDEYFFGSRAVSIAADATVIIDYAKGESTRIGRRGTYSVASLDDVARAMAAGRRLRSAGAMAWNLREGERERRGAREVIVYRSDDRVDRPHLRIEIAVDRSVALTRAGAEVIAGVAWPNERTAEAEVVLRALRGTAVSAAAAGAAPPETEHGLPLETILTWREEEEEIRFVNRITRVGRELPPPEALQIPRGARRVDDPRVAAAKLLGALDRPGAVNE